MNIQKELLKLKDNKYRDFTIKLIPNIDPKSIIGIRMPLLRKLSKEIIKENKYHNFLNELPHKYHEEYLIHALIISEIKDYDLCIKETNKLLPYINNWAVCDTFSPIIFKKHKKELIKEIDKWLKTKETYTIRFGIINLMRYYLEDDFNENYIKKILKIKNDDYYFKMAFAWYLSVALIKQYDKTIIYLEKHLLPKDIHSMTIRKALDSYRIDKKRKSYIKSLY